MKRVGGLFARIHDADALLAAAHRAALGKHERPEVREFFASLAARVVSIGADLRAGTYRFSGYRSFEIRDPKSRTIRAPTFADRVVHHALVAVVGPVLERGACEHSHACRRDRGQSASLALARGRAAHAEAFLKLDVARFYDSIDHECLRAALRRRLREERVLALFDAVLASYCVAPGKGLPIGALTSQYLGNFCLDGFDRWAERRPSVRGYQRYMDDMLFFGDLAALGSVRRDAAARLAMLGLTVKNDGVLNRCVLGVPWLGFTIYPDRVRLNAPGRRRLVRRLCELQRAAQSGEIGERERQERATALFAHAKNATDVAWRRALLARTAHREVQEPGEPRGSRRFVERHRQEVPVRVPQQEEARQSQRQPGLPRLSVPRHGGAIGPPDDAPSRALAVDAVGDKACGWAPAGAEIQRAACPEENASAGAPPRSRGVP